MPDTARTIQQMRNLRATVSALNVGERLARLVAPHLFRRVRLGTALWHTLVVAKRPLTAEEIVKLLDRGDLASANLLKSVKNGLRYHAKVGRLKYVGQERWEVRA